MARYFFDLEDSQSDPDGEGTHLSSLRSVRIAAVELLGQVLRDRSQTFWDRPDLTLTVRSDDDLILLRITVFGTLAPASG